MNLNAEIDAGDPPASGAGDRWFKSKYADTIGPTRLRCGQSVTVLFQSGHRRGIAVLGPDVINTALRAEVGNHPPTNFVVGNVRGTISPESTNCCLVEGTGWPVLVASVHRRPLAAPGRRAGRRAAADRVPRPAASHRRAHPAIFKIDQLAPDFLAPSARGVRGQGKAIVGLCRSISRFTAERGFCRLVRSTLPRFEVAIDCDWQPPRQAGCRFPVWIG